MDLVGDSSDSSDQASERRTLEGGISKGLRHDRSVEEDRYSNYFSNAQNHALKIVPRPATRSASEKKYLLLCFTCRSHSDLPLFKRVKRPRMLSERTPFRTLLIYEFKPVLGSSCADKA